MKPHLFGFTLLSLVAIVASAPAHAQNGTLTRSFVSSTGVDSNPCTITQPCATFAQAYTKIGANGIIAALDPGKYGPITIAGGVTINGNGWSAITAPIYGTGITINAGSDNVTLTGLEIDGAGDGYDGIVVNSAGNLTITNCVLKDFASGPNNIAAGIWMQPTSGTFIFTITNTTVSNVTYAGIFYQPPNGSAYTTGVIDHVVVNKSFNGIFVDPVNASSSTTYIAISNSIVSNNSQNGINITAGSALVRLTIDNVSITDNVLPSGSGAGLFIRGTPTVSISRSVITNNYLGIDNGTVNTLYTYGNNQINLNNQDSVGSALNTLYKPE